MASNRFHSGTARGGGRCRRHLGIRRPQSSAFTLVEMLAAVAVLVIVLGLMVSLARHVRERSAQALTKGLLRRLDATMTEYVTRHGGQVPPVAAFPPAGLAGQAPDATAALSAADRQALAEAADANSAALVDTFRVAGGPVGRSGGDRSLPEGLLTDLPPSVYDQRHLRDAWGSPIVFMPTKHPWVGTASREKPYFFFSAGPDRDYLTRDDNLYSYEESADPPAAKR